MKTGKIREIFSIFFAALLLLTFVIESAASPSHEAVLRIENNTVFVVIPAPEKLNGIDLTLELDSSDAAFSAVSFEGCDTASTSTDITTMPDAVTATSDFIYTYNLNTDSVSFSGYFIDSVTKDSDLIIVGFILSNTDSVTENDVLKLSYTLSCELCSKSDSATYSLVSKQIVASLTTSYPLGDTDADGIVTASDARTILRAAVGLETLSLTNIPYADADYDGTVSASDARHALRSSVGLEKTVMHRFDISLEENALCENGGIYTFTCDITGKTFSMEIANGGHLLTKSDCFSTGKCLVCNNDIQPASGHHFDENGICTTCSADKEQLSTIEAQLIPMLEEINTCDTLADEYLTGGDKSEFISYTQTATKLIKKAAVLCDNVKGMEEIHSHLYRAYKIRFSAFTACTDDDGAIFVNSKNCDTILNAVKLSNTHIDYASYIFE